MDLIQGIFVYYGNFYLQGGFWHHTPIMEISKAHPCVVQRRYLSIYSMLPPSVVLLTKRVYTQTAMTTILRAPRSTSSPPTTEIPLGVYKSTTSSRVMALGLVVLLVLTLLTNLSWIWWMLLAIVLLIGDVCTQISVVSPLQGIF